MQSDWAANEVRDDVLNELLVTPRIGISAADNLGRTPLYLTALSNRVGATEVLLDDSQADSQADRDMRDNDGRTAYDLAFEAARSGAVTARVFEKIPYVLHD